MAFENVNVASLKNSIIACRNAINYSTSSQLISSISNNSVWECASRDNLKKALDTLVNVRYKELESQLNIALMIADMIGEYKGLEQDNIEYKKRISSLSNMLYRNEEKIIKDSEGNNKIEIERIKDESVEKRIDGFQSKIIVNNSRMRILKKKISSMLGDY